MRQPVASLAVIGLLSISLFSAALESHAGAHVEGAPVVASVDSSAMHASESGHVEASGLLSGLTCPACLLRPASGGMSGWPTYTGVALPPAGEFAVTEPASVRTPSVLQSYSRAPPDSRR